MLEIHELHESIAESKKTLISIKTMLDYAGKSVRIKELDLELSHPDIWQDRQKFQLLNQERSKVFRVVDKINSITETLGDCCELLEVMTEEDNSLKEIEIDVNILKSDIAQLEHNCLFTGEQDASNAYLDIQAGSGGTEAQDWAEMMLRMYSRWCDTHAFKIEVIERSEGDVAGIKSVTLYVQGADAFGWLRTETGVHRLVRKSPFDSGNRRHTSFASVFVSPEIDDSIEVNVDPSDVRIDTYRASGAGGQHINKTDSAVRLTHEPTGTVVQCQSDRSQHKNKEVAWKQLRAKLYELALQEQRQEIDKIESNKSDISWGNQIRSYVLDDARIKDLRTGIENRNTQAVLDGHLDEFVIASLKQVV